MLLGPMQVNDSSLNHRRQMVSLVEYMKPFDWMHLGHRFCVCRNNNGSQMKSASVCDMSDKELEVEHEAS